MLFSSNESYYQIRMTLCEDQETIMRRLLVPSSIYLSRFSSALQYAMGWLGLKLHRFVAKDGCFGGCNPRSIIDPDGMSERRVKLDRLLKREADTLWYEYDLGAGTHTMLLELEKVLTA